jgi:hypothetical protein
MSEERFDSALAPWGARANAPALGQDLDDYRRDHLVRIKKLLPDDHALRSVPIRQLQPDALAVMEKQILAAASDSAWRPDAVPHGTIERRVQVDSNGQRVVHWLGTESFVKELGRPGRRVTSFRTDQGYVGADGRPLR